MLENDLIDIEVLNIIQTKAFIKWERINYKEYNIKANQKLMKKKYSIRNSSSRTIKISEWKIKLIHKLLI